MKALLPPVGRTAALAVEEPAPSVIGTGSSVRTLVSCAQTCETALTFESSCASQMLVFESSKFRLSWLVSRRSTKRRLQLKHCMSDGS